MKEKIYKDIHFNPGENEDFFDVYEKIVYGFFSFRIIKSKTREPFSIRNIYGPYHHYFNVNLDLVDIIRVTFVYLKSSDRPFVLILENSKKIKNYYRLLSYGDNRWKPIDELNEIPEHIQQKSLLDALKTSFSNFHNVQINLYDSSIVYYMEGRYKIQQNIIKDENYIQNYNRYYLKTKIPISVSKIEINGDKMEIKKNLKFVEHYYFYYQNGYEGMPLMMETVDYQIAGSLPYINYFIPESVGNKWVPVECGTDLLEPKCKSDIKRILDGVVEMYRNHPVTIDITKPKHGSIVGTIIRFSDMRFSNVIENGDHYISHTFRSKATKSFFIENIMLEGVNQEIDIQSTEFESITVYYEDEKPHRPLLICLELHNKTNTSVENFKWFYTSNFEKNVWLKLDFEAHPHNDKILIEQKIKSIYGSTIINYIMIPLKWLTFFRVLCISITFLLLRQRRRLRLILFRLYHHIRR